MHQTTTDKWLLLGDFNMILHSTDKSNNILNTRLMGAFKEVVKDLELKELSLRGRKFTWSNQRTHTQIDRAFCSIPWDLMMPNVVLQALSSQVSDHCPLLIAGGDAVKNYRGFHFELFWLQLPGFSDVVAAAWARPLNIFNPFLCLHTKLQRVSKALRAWAKAIIGHKKLLLCATSKLIGILDVVQDYRQLSDQEMLLHRDLKARFLGLTAVEKLRAKQRSRLISIRVCS
jgi:hypothetical protein